MKTSEANQCIILDRNVGMRNLFLKCVSHLLIGKQMDRVTSQHHSILHIWLPVTISCLNEIMQSLRQGKQVYLERYHKLFYERVRRKEYYLILRANHLYRPEMIFFILYRSTLSLCCTADMSFDRLNSFSILIFMEGFPVFSQKFQLKCD